jgi:hypothetical protein
MNKHLKMKERNVKQILLAGGGRVNREGKGWIWLKYFIYLYKNRTNLLKLLKWEEGDESNGRGYRNHGTR